MCVLNPICFPSFPATDCDRAYSQCSGHNPQFSKNHKSLHGAPNLSWSSWRLLCPPAGRQEVLEIAPLGVRFPHMVGEFWAFFVCQSPALVRLSCRCPQYGLQAHLVWLQSLFLTSSSHADVLSTSPINYVHPIPSALLSLSNGNIN